MPERDPHLAQLEAHLAARLEMEQSLGVHHLRIPPLCEDHVSRTREASAPSE